MRDSVCSWLNAENAKIFRSYVKLFKTFSKLFSHMKKITESWLVHVHKLSWIIQSCFLIKTIKQSELQILLWEKNKFYLKKCDSYNGFNLSKLQWN